MIYIVIVVIFEGKLYQINYTSMIYVIVVVILEGNMHQIDKLHKHDLHNYCGNFGREKASDR